MAMCGRCRERIVLCGIRHDGAFTAGQRVGHGQAAESGLRAKPSRVGASSWAGQCWQRRRAGSAWRAQVLGADTFRTHRHFIPTLVRAAICAGVIISDGFAGSLCLFGMGDSVGVLAPDACDSVRVCRSSDDCIYVSGRPIAPCNVLDMRCTVCIAAFSYHPMCHEVVSTMLPCSDELLYTLTLATARA